MKISQIAHIATICVRDKVVFWVKIKKSHTDKEAATLENLPKVQLTCYRVFIQQKLLMTIYLKKIIRLFFQLISGCLSNQTLLFLIKHCSGNIFDL